MSARSKARKRALDVLYASELRGESAIEALERAIDEGEGPTNEYTADLVRGVVDHQPRIDEVLASYSEGWALERMPAVDRNVLRLGIYELLYVDDVPDAVAVSEAMALVRDLSTDESPQFVNGVLGAVVRNKPTPASEVIPSRRDGSFEASSSLLRRTAEPSSTTGCVRQAVPMSDVQQVDLVVVGLGPGGEALANATAKAGLAVVAVDKHLVGGECPYYGCIPTKMMVRAADALAEAGRAAELAGDVTVTSSWAPVAERVSVQATDHWDDRVAVERLQKAGATVLHGVARLDGTRRVVVTPADGSEPVTYEAVGASSSTPAPGRRCRRSRDWRTRRSGPTATPCRSPSCRLAGGARRRPDRLRAGAGLRPVRRPGHRGPARRPAAAGQRAGGVRAAGRRVRA